MTRRGGKAFDVFFGNGLRQLVGTHGRKDAQCGFGADAADFDQLAEGGALVRRGEAEQQMRIFAHDKLGVKLHRLAGCGQTVESLHGHVHLVTHAVDVDNGLWRIFFNKYAFEPADHVVFLNVKGRLKRKPSVSDGLNCIRL